MTVINTFYGTLSSLGFPVYRHGTLGDDEPLPDTYITYMVDGSDDAFPFDNEITYTDWDFAAFIYSRNPQTVQELAVSVRQTLKAAGFIPQGKGIDYPTEEADFSAWTISFRAIKPY